MPVWTTPYLFAALLSGMMSALVTTITLLRTTGLVEGFAGLLLQSWLWSWAVAFPAALIVAPIARRLVARLVRAG